MTADLPGAAVAMLACPVCGAGLTVDGSGLSCAAGHAYDRARQGHVTLLPPGTGRRPGTTRRWSPTGSRSSVPVTTPA